MRVAQTVSIVIVKRCNTTVAVDSDRLDDGEGSFDEQDQVLNRLFEDDEQDQVLN